MQFLEHFYKKTLKYEFANKFYYIKTKDIPKIKKVVLNFNCNTKNAPNVTNLSSSLLALELISSQKGMLTKTKISNIRLKLKKGNPVGCMLILKKRTVYNFIARIIQEISPLTKIFIPFKSNHIKNALSFEIIETFDFSELEEQYHLFNTVSKLNITVILTTKSVKELSFMLQSFQLPLKNLQI